jgi:toxin ParE1/3/4
MAKTTPRVVRNPAAVVDIIEVADYIAQTTSLTAADRFIAATDRTFEQLAAMPGMGTRYEPDDPAYADIRYFPVSKFRNYLVFYRPLPDGIEVVRVLHGARDIAAIFEEEE